MASADVHEDVSCSICLHFYTDPVTLNCGHNFCRECIETYLDTKERNHEEYSCPQCRKRFRGRPELQKNTDLSNIAEKVKSSAGQEKRKCPDHNRILEYYCTEDAACICVVCKFDDKHRGHEVENLEEATEKKKKKLNNDLQKLRRKREETDKRDRDLTQCKNMAEEHVAELTKKVDTLFKDIRKCLKDLKKRVRRELSRQAKLKYISGLIHTLELEREELCEKIGRLEELSTADPITLLQDQESDEDIEEDLGIKAKGTSEPDEFIISMMLQKGLSDIEKMRNDLFPVPLQGADITLDIKTAANDVEISDDKKSYMFTDEDQKRRNPANRFKNGVVLSTREFSSGKHYWMVEGSTSGIWAVGVCYPSIKKSIKWIGQDSESWAIVWYCGSYGVWHNDHHKPFNDTNSSNKVLVYLDYEAGRLSYYELSDPLRFLCTFHRKFTKPLHAVIQVNEDITDNTHGQITLLQKDAWCNPMLGPIPSV